MIKKLGVLAYINIAAIVVYFIADYMYWNTPIDSAGEALSEVLTALSSLVLGGVTLAMIILSLILYHSKKPKEESQ